MIISRFFVFVFIQVHQYDHHDMANKPQLACGQSNMTPMLHFIFEKDTSYWYKCGPNMSHNHL